MTPAEAKEILLAYRPGSADARDPRIVEALSVARDDPGLQEWLRKHAAFQQAMRLAFRRIPVPGDLRARILDRAKLVRLEPWWRRPITLTAAAAAAVILLGLAGLWRMPTPEDSFVTFRSRMVRSVLREYRMDLRTSDTVQIRQYLATNHAPADFMLRGSLAQLPLLGAGLLSWEAQKVAMVCLDSGDRGTLFVFVVDQAALKKPPAAMAEFSQVNRLITASWSEGGRTYVVAGEGAKEWLQSHLRATPGETGPGKRAP